MHLIDVVSKFKTEDECLDYLVKVRFPFGVCCIKCGMENVQEMRIAASRRKNGKFIPARRLFRCMNEDSKCKGYQFSAKTGTIFDKSHLPLTKWFLATYLICQSRKGMSANQICGMSGLPAAS